MQLVIDIPEELYEANNRGLEAEELWDLRMAVKNGIPIPKNHGRLIDADELFWDIQTDEQMRLGEHLAWVKERIDNAPTIIEADKSESEEKE